MSEIILITFSLEEGDQEGEMKYPSDSTHLTHWNSTWGEFLSMVCMHQEYCTTKWYKKENAYGTISLEMKSCVCNLMKLHTQVTSLHFW